MKKYLFHLICLMGISGLLGSCSNSDSDQDPGIVAGEVIVVFHDSTPLVPAYNLIDSLGFQMSFLRNFGYEIEAIEDSVQIIESLLLDKDYLNHDLQTNRTTFSSPFIRSNIHFNGLSSADLTDWLGLIDDIGFQEVPGRISGAFKWSVVFVPEGSEQHWANFLNEHPLVSSGSVNNIIVGP